MRFHFPISYSGKALLTLSFLLLFYFAPAQEKCGTVQYEALLKDRSYQKDSKPAFEEWIQSEISRKKIRRQNLMSTLSEETYTIPVVVHVIHNGESMGVGANISTERILSQIATLNQDFQRQNADTVNTPAAFKGVAANTRIAFALARRDPEGLPTSGITREKGHRATYSIYTSWDLKSQSYWPAEDYLNIWVAPLDNTLLGFAQFPESATQPGLEDASVNRLTDGVVIDYDYFGTNPAVNPSSKGRTATHEIGHYLGLRHIWGDGHGGCDVDDYCEDTPLADDANYGCPTGEVISCGGVNMVQNFMDYSSDACMNLFTIDQMERMHAVLLNSPRRASLLLSKGALPPEVVANDLGIKKIVAPSFLSCDKVVAPEILVKNYGSNDISSFKILFSVNGDTIDSLYQSIHLLPLDSIKVSFPTFSLADTSDFLFSFHVKEANEVVDNNVDNNNKVKALHLPKKAVLPIEEDFESAPFAGTISNPDGRIGWNVAPAPHQDQGNRALKMSCFDYSADVGEKDFFYTDIFDLTEYKSATVSFRLAYAQYSMVSGEGFQVIISTDCGRSFQEEDILYESFGDELATAKSKMQSFSPDGRLEWKNMHIDLSPYLGMENLRLAFVGINDYGNNIFLDDILISGATASTSDLKIQQVEVPPVMCMSPFVPKVDIVNKGLNAVSGFSLTASSVWKNDVKINYNGPPLQPGDTTTISLPEILPKEGQQELAVQIDLPDGLVDKYPEDNFNSIRFRVDTVRELLPLREQFTLEEGEQFNWFISNPDNSTTWEFIETAERTTNQAIYLNHYNYKTLNEKDWLISPLLDFSKTSEVNLSFMVSYAYNYNYKDRLQVLISTDCGLHYSAIAYDVAGKDISSTYSTAPWSPDEKVQWNKISLSLDEFIGAENVRIAFVVNNGYGNNLYLDDIEFFVSQEPEEPLPNGQFYAFPNPARDILPVVFNLQERENVQIALIDLRGQLLYKGNFPNTLNQMYEIDISTLSDAVYLIKISGDSFSEVKRILIQK